MNYAAKHYVRISGRKYTPGEMIDIPIPEEKLKRLLRLKAVERVPAVIVDPADEDTDGEDGGSAAEAQNNSANPLENLGHDPFGDPHNETPEDKESSEEIEEVAEEVEVPKIDVMDGIVPAAEAAEEAQPREVRKKTTSKGRKKA